MTLPVPSQGFPDQTPDLITNILEALSFGEITLEGQFVWGSNYTFLVKVQHMDDPPVYAVYKPLQGERPLWDFPRFSLAKREVAAFRTSQALGWDFVPPTVLSANGPAGPGSLQLFVEVDPERHYYTFSKQETQRLRPVVLFDIIINNADRKAGHVLLGPDEKIWLIDHGVCFHQVYKLRTVIWDFVGEAIPDKLMHEMNSLLKLMEDDESIQGMYEALLSDLEITALRTRIETLLERGVFPDPEQERPFPWPLV